MATKPTDSVQLGDTLDTSLFYLCMHYQHAFKWTNSAWTLCVMLCCVCRQLAHHNHHITPRWLGILLKCVHTLGLRACELCCRYQCCWWRPPPPLSPPTLDVLHTCTLESLICKALCVLFIMLLHFPCITAAGCILRSWFTPPSRTVFSCICLHLPMTWVFLAEL